MYNLAENDIQPGPDVTLKDDTDYVEIWVELSSTDENGISIDGVRKGDTIEIESISGICSFTDTKKKILSGFVSIVSGVLQGGALYYNNDESKAIKEIFDKQATKLQDELDKDIGNKRRDGYGQDPGTGDYGKHEGGIIVCMPEAGGVLYATSENYLASGSKKDSRLPKYFSDNVKEKNSFFPSREKGGMMKATADKDGTIFIIVFDNKFVDNAGTYQIKLILTRNKTEEEHNKIKAMLQEKRE